MRRRGIAPYAYGLPQIPAAARAAPNDVSSATTGDMPQQRQQNTGFGDALSLYRMVKGQAKAPAAPGLVPYQGTPLEQLLTGPATGPMAGVDVGVGPGLFDAVASEGVMPASEIFNVGSGLAPGEIVSGGLGLDGLAGGGAADTLGGVAPAMMAAAPEVLAPALPAAAIEAVGAPASAGGLAGLGAMGPVALGGLGIFGLGKLFDWW